MQKNQVKPTRDKKKNIETGILMGQNTNIFSQLSATFLQAKSSNTEEEEKFLKNTQIVQYHDQNINRLISLLRKKAEVTKIKAVLELKEEIAKMQAPQLEQFIATFAQLFFEIVLNQPSKQIVEEFVTIITDLISKHKKIVVREINTLYGPLLLTIKTAKLAGLLFTGTEMELQTKAIVLLMKKEVMKKFLIMVRIILECEGKEKVGLAHYQRNCLALMKTVKDFIKIYLRNEKAKELQSDFAAFVDELEEILHHTSIEEYFKIGGKAKASILELQTTLVELAVSHPHWKIRWEYHAKQVSNAFLEKDGLVQQTLWRYCNRPLLQCLLDLQQQRIEGGQQTQSILNIYYSKSEEKLLNCFKVGGFAFYKELHSYLEIFPSTTFAPNETHKTLINKINFQRKLLTSILQEEDQNEARSECYFNVTGLLLTRIRDLQVSQLDEKKAKEVRSLCLKLEKQTVQNLQERYYSDPPSSKNSFTYYVPQYFGKIINAFKPTFDIKFHPDLTFKLYEQVHFTPDNSPFLDEIFAKCKGNLQLLLKYMEIFPARQVEIDMSESNPEVELTAKLFILTNRKDVWVSEEWDQRKNVIVFDPRVAVRDLQAEEDDDILSFRPLARNFSNKIYDKIELDNVKIDYFLKCLESPQLLPTVKYLIPMVNDVILPRNPTAINRLLEAYETRARQLKEGKWAIGKIETSLLRVVSCLVIDHISKQHGTKHINPQLLHVFLQSYCEFVRLISNYRMDAQVEDLLKRFTNLLIYEELRPTIFQSCRRSILLACEALLKGDSQQQKVRKNRLARCTDLISKLLWYCFSRTNTDGHIQLAKNLASNASNWKNAMTRGEPWLLLHALIDKISNEKLALLAREILQNLQENSQFILLVLNADAILPLQAHLEARTLYIFLKKSLEKAILELPVGPQRQCLRSIIKQMFGQNIIQLAEGVKNLVSQILIENEQNSEMIEYLGGVCVVQPFEQFIKAERSIYRSLVFIDLISVIPLRKLANIEAIYAVVADEIAKQSGLKYLQILSIACVFWNKNVGVEAALPKFKDILSKTISSAQLHIVLNSPLSHNFSTYALFSLVNSLVSHAGREVLADVEDLINKQFWRAIEEGSELHGLAQSLRMKYATRSILTAKEEAVKLMIKLLPQVGLQQFVFYGELLAQIEDDTEEELPHHEHIITLFQEFAEFLLRLISHLTPTQYPNEETILRLIQCPFPALKKAAFLLLKAMYELKIVAREPPKIYGTLLKLEMKGDEELTSKFCSKMSTYLYTWQALILRRVATQRVEGEEESLSLEEYIQSEGLSDLLIKNSFFVLEDKLDYMRHEADLTMTTEDLLAADIVADLFDESEMELKLFRMTLQTLFAYVVNFPIFLRGFMDQNKKYKNICDRLLRNIISDAIFREEVAKIEMLEPQWKAAGNFEIYVTPKSKEIYAEYTHDVIRIGLRLVMRGNYPLSPIDIQFGQGLKIEEGSRWGLMLQSQLHNRNNTIINGILLWKDNIDKKLSGVEECSICFDIVNSSGQLPKKGCKTCRKKFHGNCIMKWFTKSNKSECPLCKSQFL